MPKTFTQNNFSQGWVPSDDPINGRQNGLIKMENITLAENGSLTIANGSTNEYTLSTGKVHTIFANTVSHVYSVCDDGKAYYNTTQLYTDCSDSAAAFCIAGNALLFNSGSELQILTGTSSTTRGFNLDTPAVPVKLETGFFSLITEVGSIITLYNYLTNTDKENGDWSFSFGDYTYEIDPELTAYDVSSTNIPLTAGGTYTYDNSWVATASKTVSSATDAQGTFNGDFKAQALFTSDTTANLSALYAYPLIPPQPGRFFLGLNNTKQTTDADIASADDDIISCRFYVPSYYSGWRINKVTLQILLIAPVADGDAVTDYYEGELINPSPEQYQEILILSAQRSNFKRVGTGTETWATVAGFNYIINVSYDYTSLTDLQAFGTSGEFDFGLYYGFFKNPETCLQAGIEYKYALQWVDKTSFDFIVKSALSPTYSIGTPSVACCSVLKIAKPTDTNATDVYLFRQVNGTWYKVKTIALSDFLIADPLARIDDTSDIEAEDLDIFQDPNYVAANTILDSDPALAIIGPIEGRWLYFTAKFIYFSEINNPTYIDTVKTVKSIASTLETFYWAKQVDADTILVGTSNDIYKLYGTFITLPDNTVDVYYKPLNTTYRPVSKNATEYNNSVIYLATSGWRIADVSGASISLVGDKLDLLYQGETPNGITAPSFTSPDFPCCVVKDKFYAAVNTTASTQRIEVYDFTRKYWHTRIDSTNDVTAFLALTPNGILAGINNSTDGSKIVTYDDPAGTNSLAVSIETLYFDLQAPRNRKDLFTFKARIAANDTVTFSLTDEAGTAHAIGTMAPASTSIKELFLDLSTLDPIKYAKLAITCTTDYFKLDDFSIDFEVRPTPITFFKKYSQNFGSASKKRLRVWPVVIDTLGHDVTYTPIVDGTSKTTITLNSTGKRTLLPQIVTDFFGIDYDYELLGTNEFEYWEDVTPEIVQVLPIAKRFDQVGPEELFRYGVIKRIEVRVLPIDGGSGATLDLPWKIYFQDTSVATGNFEVTEGVEGSYFIGVPKGTSGQVIRIELGPTTWDFHRYYMMALVMKSGRDTDNEWIPLGVNPNG